MTHKKSKFLRNLLTSASAVAVLAGGAQSAMAAPAAAVHIIHGANINLEDAAIPVARHYKADGTDHGANTAILANAHVYVAEAGRTLTVGADRSKGFIDAAGHVTVIENAAAASINLRNSIVTDDADDTRKIFTAAGAAVLNGVGGGGVVAKGGTALGGVGGTSGGTASPVFDIKFANANDITVAGGIEHIRNVDFNNKANELVLGSAGEIKAFFSGDAGGGGDNGIIRVANNIIISDKAGGGTAFDATGGQKVNKIYVEEGKTLTLNTNTTLSGAITIGKQSIANAKAAALGAATLVVKGGKTVTVPNIDGVTTAGAGAEDRRGTLTFEGAGIVAGVVGANKALTAINIGKADGSAGGVVDFQAPGAAANTIKAGTINLTNAASELTLSANAHSITADIKNTSVTDAKGKINVNQNTTIVGDIGADGASLQQIIVADNKALNIKGRAATDDGVVYVGDIKLNAGGGGDATLTFSDHSVTLTGNITNNGNTKGTVNVNKSTKIVGNIGAAGANALAVVNVADANTLTLNSGVLHATNLSAGGPNAKLAFDGDYTIVANKVGNAVAFKNIAISGGTVEFKSTGAGAFAAGNRTNKAETFTLGENGVMKLSTTEQVTKGAIIGTEVGDAQAGTLEIVRGDVAGTTGVQNVIGSIGAAAAKANTGLAGINFTGADVAYDGFLVVSDNNQDFNAGKVTTDVDGKGNILISSKDDKSISGQFGAPAKEAPAEAKKHLGLFLVANHDAADKTFTLAEGAKIYANNFMIADGGTLQADWDVFGIAAAIANQNNTVILQDGVTINGNVVTNLADNGKLSVAGNATITGNIGNNEGNVKVAGNTVAANNHATADNIHSITFTADNKTLTVGGTQIKTNDGINFANKTGATLALTNTEAPAAAGATTVTVASKVTVAADGKGILDLSDPEGNALAEDLAKANAALAAGNPAVTHRVVEFQGKIGDATAKHGVATAKVGAMTHMKLGANTDNSQINELILKSTGTGDEKRHAILELNTAGNYRLGVSGSHENENIAGVVRISENINLLENSTLGTEDIMLSEMNFVGDRALTLEKGINVFADNWTTKGKDEGKIELKGPKHDIYGNIGTNDNKFHSIQAKADKVADGDAYIFHGDIHLSDALTISTKNTTVFKGERILAAKGIVTNENYVDGHTSTVRFENADATVVNADIGANGKGINTLEVAGGDLTFETGRIWTKNIKFTGESKATLTAGQALAGTGQTVITSTGDKIHSLKLKTTAAVGPIDFNERFGTSENQMADLIISGTQKVILSKKDFYAGLKATNSNEVTVELNVADLVVRGVGEDGVAIFSLTAKENATINGATYADSIEVSAGKRLTLSNGKVAGTSLITLGGTNATTVLDLKEVESVAQKIVAATNEAGSVVSTTGSNVTTTTFLNDIGTSTARVNRIELKKGEASTEVHVIKNLYGETIDIDDHVVRITQDSTIGGNLSADGTTFDLERNTLVFSSASTASTFANSLTFKTKYFEADGERNIGKVRAETGAKLDFNGIKDSSLVVDLDIDLTNITNEAVGTEGIDLTIFDGQKEQFANLTSGKLKINNVSGTVNKDIFFSLEQGEDVRIIKVINTSDKAVGDILGKLGANKAEIAEVQNYVNPKSTGSASKVFDEFREIHNNESASLARETINREKTPLVSETEAAVVNVATQVNGVVSSRLGSQLSGNLVALAAGDEAMDANYGVWFNPFYSTATQKARSSNPGYKVDSTGGTIGFDAAVNDRLTLGAAATMVRSKVKHKNLKAGDKTTADTVMFSIYGSQQVADNWFVQGLASFGSSKIKSTEKHRVGAKTTYAGSKHDVMTYGAEVLAGYNVQFEEMFSVTPTFGIAYNRFNQSGSKQSGSTVAAHDQRRNNYDKFEAIAGVRANMVTEIEDVTLTPDLHAFVRQNLSNKAIKVEHQLDGTAGKNPTVSNKPIKTFFNVGAGLMAKYHMMEYGVSYDAHMGKKYLSHSGSLKLRVNF